jgi:hypothetical protein
MAFWQQVDTGLRARGLLVGLPAGADVELRLHKGTCEEPGALIAKRAAAADTAGSAVIRLARERPADTLLGLDEGEGSVTLVVDGTKRRCHEIVVWPLAHRVVAGLGFTPRSETTVSGSLYTAAPGTIEAFDTEAGTAVIVQGGIRLSRGRVIIHSLSNDEQLPG